MEITPAPVSRKKLWIIGGIILVLVILLVLAFSKSSFNKSLGARIAPIGEETGACYTEKTQDFINYNCKSNITKSACLALGSADNHFSSFKEPIFLTGESCLPSGEYRYLLRGRWGRGEDESATQCLLSLRLTIATNDLRYDNKEELEPLCPNGLTPIAHTPPEITSEPETNAWTGNVGYYRTDCRVIVNCILPTLSSSPTPTPTFSLLPSQTIEPSVTPTFSVSPSSSPTATYTPFYSPTYSPVTTWTPYPSFTSTWTPRPSPV